MAERHGSLFRFISMRVKTQEGCIAVLGLKASYTERKPLYEISIAHRKLSATIHPSHYSHAAHLQIKEHKLIQRNSLSLVFSIPVVYDFVSTVEIMQCRIRYCREFVSYEQSLVLKAI
jgi:hypothetical protein